MIDYLVYLAASCNGYHPSITRSITNMSYTGGIVWGVGELQMSGWHKLKDMPQRKKKMRIYMEVNLAIYLSLIEFTDLNMSKFLFLKYIFINYH